METPKPSLADLLAEKHEEFADGTIDQLPLFGLVLAGLAGDGFCGSGRQELFDSGFDHLCAVILRAPAFSTARPHAAWAGHG
jgi:hypothetical protein